MLTQQVPPTRQELLALKKKTKTAQRGHDLLKDKRDSLMQMFFAAIRTALRLRQLFDERYQQAFTQFQLAEAQIDPQYLQTLSQTATVTINIQSHIKHIMGIKIPELESSVSGDPVQYSFSATNTQLDNSLKSLRDLLPELLELMEYEYKILLLAKEIEKTRRRVNSLNYVVVPQLKRQTRFIRDKLEEQSRDATVSLMKFKSKSN